MKINNPVTKYLPSSYALILVASAISTPIFASDYCQGKTGCARKACEIRIQIDAATKANNPNKIKGLQTALNKVNAYCSDEALKADLEDKIADQQEDIKEVQEDIKEVEADLAEAKADDRADKVTKYQGKLREKNLKLKNENNKLIQLQNELTKQTK